MADMAYGKVAYESYADDREFKTHDNKLMPPWSDLGYAIQHAWTVAANTTIVCWQGKHLDGNS